VNGRGSQGRARPFPRMLAALLLFGAKFSFVSADERRANSVAP
jgi:hypothetical protein